MHGTKVDWQLGTLIIVIGLLFAGAIISLIIHFHS